MRRCDRFRVPNLHQTRPQVSRGCSAAWPRRNLLRRGPFTATVGGNPVTRSDGSIRLTGVPRHCLGVCIDCNNWHNHTFEVPGQQVIRAVFGGLSIGGSKVEMFARWWLKTLLLELHPSTRELSDGSPILQDVRTGSTAAAKMKLRGA